MVWGKRIMALVLAIAALAAIVFALLPRPQRVELGTVTRGRFQQTVDEDGRTRVRERYTVTAPIAGRVLRIALKPGDEVSEGMPVATIVAVPAPMLDARTRQQLEQRVGAAEGMLLRAKAAVERARATLDQARADLNRTRGLAESGIASRSRLERDELGAKVAAREMEAALFDEHTAEHDLGVAQAALANPGAETGSDPWVVRAPVMGRVFRVMQESGGPVAIGTPLLEIGNPSDLEVLVDVLSTDAVEIAAGAPVLIEGWGGDHPLQGRVRRVEPSAFTKVSALGVEEQRVNVLIDILSPDTAWRGLGDGYRVDAHIVVFDASDAVKVPVSALFRESEAWKVFVDVGGVARKRTVEVERLSSVDAMVGSGLTEGQKVVLYPGETMRDGAAVVPR